MVLAWEGLSGKESAEAQIESLIYHFAWLVDHGRETELADLFIEEGRLIVPDVGRDWAKSLVVEGRASLMKRWSGGHSRLTRHVFNNIRIRFRAPSQAEATSVVIGFRHEGEGFGYSEPFLVGDYLDQIVRVEDGRWLFAERKIIPVFIGRKWHPLSHAARI